MLSFINKMQHVKYILRKDAGVLHSSIDPGLTFTDETGREDVTYTAAPFGIHSSNAIDNSALSFHCDEVIQTYIIGYPDKVYLSYRSLIKNEGTELTAINHNTQAVTCMASHVAQYIKILMLQGMSNNAIIDRLIERLGLDRGHFRIYDINDYKIPRRSPAALPYYKVQGYVKPRRKIIAGKY